MRILVLLVLVLAGCSSSTATGSSSPPATSSTSSTSSGPVARQAAAPGVVDPAVASTWPKPSDTITPGVTVVGCTYPRATTERSVLQSTKTNAAAAYGYTGGTGLENVEYDHRVPFALCGGNGAGNIWPEPVDGVTQTAYVHNRKDQLEAYGARQVRYGRWTLGFAQAVFRGDWPAAWCRYLHYAGVTC